MKTTLNHSTSLYPRSSGKIQLKRQAKYDMNNVKQELVVSSVSGNEIAKKKRNTRKHELTIDQMKQYFEYSQSQAARLLGVSVSTLKRVSIPHSKSIDHATDEYLCRDTTSLALVNGHIHCASNYERKDPSVMF